MTKEQKFCKEYLYTEESVWKDEVKAKEVAETYGVAYKDFLVLEPLLDSKCAPRERYEVLSQAEIDELLLETPSRPRGIISQEEMDKIMYEVHEAEETGSIKIYYEQFRDVLYEVMKVFQKSEGKYGVGVTIKTNEDYYCSQLVHGMGHLARAGLNSSSRDEESKMLDIYHAIARLLIMAEVSRQAYGGRK